MNRLLIMALLVCMNTSLSAQNKKNIDSIMKEYSGKVPGAALMIIQDGKILVNRCYGMAELENGRRVKSTTNFRLASVSKQFTAVSIMLLAEAGKINLDQKIGAIFPDYPDYGRSITIRHMLTHTSGIPDYEDFVSDTAFHPQIKDAGVLGLLMKSGKPYFPPGTAFRYSNSGYALLALIVEKYSGLSYPAFLKQYIFEPLGMNSTLAFEDGISTVPERAYGYSPEKDEWVSKDQSSTSAVLGDGGIYSNAEDMYRWDQSIYTEKILPARRWMEIFSPARLNNGTSVPYGFGWHLKQKDGAAVVYHTGSSTSFRNIFYRVPDINLSLILLTNRNQPEESGMVVLAEKIIQAFRTENR